MLVVQESVGFMVVVVASVVQVVPLVVVQVGVVALPVYGGVACSSNACTCTCGDVACSGATCTCGGVVPVADLVVVEVVLLSRH